MRNWERINSYYDELLQDVYAQPPDKWHTDEIRNVIRQWIGPLKISSVLDVGCGEGEAQEFFEELGIRYWGIALGSDVINAGTRNVSEEDFNCISAKDDSYNLVFSRHSLEHSPMPLITLMEWHRVSSKWLCVVIPNPDYFTDMGRNHYSVMRASQAAWLLRRAGWKVKKVKVTHKEYWFLGEKFPRIGVDGWTDTLTNKIYEFERDIESPFGEKKTDELF